MPLLDTFEASVRSKLVLALTLAGVKLGNVSDVEGGVLCESAATRADGCWVTLEVANGLACWTDCTPDEVGVFRVSALR